MTDEIEPASTSPMMGMPQMHPRAADHGKFREAIAHAINCCSRENGSATPDFILAQYLANCLDAFDTAMGQRAQWYGRIETIGGTRIVPRPVVADQDQPNK